MKIIYVKRVAKGGGGEGGGSNHTSHGISLLNHASRIIFLTNDVKGVSTLRKYCKILTYRMYFVKKVVVIHRGE